MFLTQLIFVSTLNATLTFDGRVKLMHAIIRKSSEQSQADGALVTGILVSIDEYFVEVLESSTEKVSFLLKQIMNNQAHANLIVKSVKDIERRRFREFPKKGCYVIKSNGDYVRDFTINERFNPYELDAVSLSEFSKGVPSHYQCLVK